MRKAVELSEIAVQLLAPLCTNSLLLTIGGEEKCIGKLTILVRYVTSTNEVAARQCRPRLKCYGPALGVQEAEDVPQAIDVQACAICPSPENLCYIIVSGRDVHPARCADSAAQAWLNLFELGCSPLHPG